MPVGIMVISAEADRVIFKVFRVEGDVYGYFYSEAREPWVRAGGCPGPQLGWGSSASWIGAAAAHLSLSGTIHLRPLGYGTPKAPRRATHHRDDGYRRKGRRYLYAAVIMGRVTRQNGASPDSEIRLRCGGKRKIKIIHHNIRSYYIPIYRTANTASRAALVCPAPAA